MIRRGGYTSTKTRHTYVKAVPRLSLVWRLLCLCLCACFMLCVLSACRASDALTEIVYDQESDTVDYDNPEKFYINNSEAKKESEDVSASETSKKAAADTEVQNLVVYSSDPNASQYEAKQSIWDEDPAFDDIEASETVHFYYSNKKDAVDQEVESTEKKEKKDNSSDNTKSTSDSASSEGSSDTTTGSGTGKTKSNSSDETEAVEDEEGAGSGGSVSVAYDSSDPNQEVKKVNTVAAYGVYATIVQMIGGDGALVASDKTTLTGGFSDVFDTEQIAKAWSDDGSSVKNLDVDKLIKSDADTVLVTSSKYLDGLAKKDRKKLNAYFAKKGDDYGATVVYPMTNSKYIKKDVDIVAEMLSESTEIQYASKTEARAETYKNFHNDCVGACSDANGGLAGSTVYQSTKDDTVKKLAGEDNNSIYTVVVNAWEDASCSRSSFNNQTWSPGSGLAFVAGGYSLTPTSFYIQAGGLINNAAKLTAKTDSGEYVLWQFRPTDWKFKTSEWSGDTVTENANYIKSSSFLSTTINEDGAGFGQSFGSECMPKIIATSSSIKKSLIENSEKNNGMYHPYDYQENGLIKSIQNSVGLYACIGSDGSNTQENLFADDGQIPGDSICINPTGLFNSWTEGSVESFLEAAWVNDVVKGNEQVATVSIDDNSYTGWEDITKGFYSTFYSYKMSDNDLSTMQKGESD